MNKVIAKVENLSHKYSRDWAIRDINFEVFNKGILGLLGSNGAGKSTTMNILCGVINQTEGNAFIDGINMRSKPVEAKKLIGFLPQKAPLHIELTVDEYLTHCAHLRSIPKAEIPDALERANSFETEKIRVALAVTNMNTFYGGIKFSPQGNNFAKAMALRHIQNGELHDVVPSKYTSHRIRWPRRASEL